MPKTRKDEGLGDWSSTGTFLRKPTTGWLHEDHELCNQSSINYRIQYLGCIEVCQSMRTLQYNMRTQVTKEAIVRMANHAGKLQQQRKKKGPKQLNRLLGAVDTRWSGEVNLAVSAEYLKISNANSNREIMNHSLPSISFASGGDGPTLDFIGYVAKDPVHERACHVFECVDCSQYVLTTIGQAFELRYKMYLNSPTPEPMQIRDSIATGDSWTQSANHTYEQRETEPSLPREPPSPYSSVPGAGIYSDLPEFPSDALPSPSPSNKSPDLPPLTAVSGGRSRVYSQLPGFPTLTEEDSSASCLSNGTTKHSPSTPRLDNPYDTITHRSSDRSYTAGVYSEPGEITTSSDEYSTNMMTIKQGASRSTHPELIDLTPPFDQQPNHVYGNTGAQNGDSSSKGSSIPAVKPRPVPRPRTTVNKPPSSAEVIYDNPELPPPIVRGRGQHIIPSNDYDDPDALQITPKTPPVVDGVYDDIQDVIGSAKNKKQSPPPPVVPKGVKNSPPPLVARRGVKNRVAMERKAPPPVYDDPNTIINTNNSSNSVPNTQYETPTEPIPPPLPALHNPRSHTPKFDDTIYAMRQDVQLEGDEEMDSGVVRNRQVSRGRQSAIPDPLAPLTTQHYFHGVISRVEAEALLENEGEFLVRESSKIPGQFVLTGVSHDGLQHLLLMDKAGMVKSRDHQFDSVPHLVDYFTTRDIPLVIGKSQVFLKKPIINEYPLSCS